MVGNAVRNRWRRCQFEGAVSWRYAQNSESVKSLQQEETMIEPSLSLAVSVQSNPGVYALLIGSGVSRSSGVPTGWEIVVELIRRLAKLKGEECGNDPRSEERPVGKEGR